MLKTDRRDGVLWLNLARPDRGNALAPELVEQLLDAVNAAADDRAIHTLCLQGQGPHFCTGLDLSDLADCRDGDMLHRLVRIETLLAALWHAPFRTVAVAHGRTWGAGADLLAACEVRLARPDASFRFPGARFGIVLGTRRLAQHVGAERARAVTTEGLQWGARDAVATGLLHHLLPDDVAAAPACLAQACASPVVDAATAAALRAATRADRRDEDLATLVRSAAVPGLVERMKRYRAALSEARPRPA
jgi:enoyl-CoA hydratase/carnithine racemase